MEINTDAKEPYDWEASGELFGNFSGERSYAIEQEEIGKRTQRIERYEALSDVERLLILGAGLERVKGSLKSLSSVDYGIRISDIFVNSFGFMPNELSPELKQAAEFIKRDNNWIS